MTTPETLQRPGPRYWMRQADVPAYQTANPHHTYNQRLMGPEMVGNESFSS
jgi:hypothetical protein